MRDELRAPDHSIVQTDKAVSTIKVDRSEVDAVANILARAYSQDPLFLWAMPNEKTRVEDAEVFYKFFLRRVGCHEREVFITSDYSAAAVMALVGVGEEKFRGCTDYFPAINGTASPVAVYFKWIESLRPDVPHHYIEFIGCLPTERSRGKGSLLLGSILEAIDRSGLPIWTCSSSRRNLSFYKRMGFETGVPQSRDASTPGVTPLWRPAMELR